MTLVTGGARSGKSSFAEEKVKEFGKTVLYIATSIPFDDEMRERIKRHRERRPLDWLTVEAYKDFDTALSKKLAGVDSVLFDCITVMVTNIMLEMEADWEVIGVERVNEIEEAVDSEIDKLINLIKESDAAFVVVSNELGSGLVPPYAVGRAMRDIAGRANQKLAKASDEVYLCVSGIPVKIK